MGCVRVACTWRAADQGGPYLLPSRAARGPFSSAPTPPNPRPVPSPLLSLGWYLQPSPAQPLPSPPSLRDWFNVNPSPHPRQAALPSTPRACVCVCVCVCVSVCVVACGCACVCVPLTSPLPLPSPATGWCWTPGLTRCCPRPAAWRPAARARCRGSDPAPQLRSPARLQQQRQQQCKSSDFRFGSLDL